MYYVYGYYEVDYNNPIYIGKGSNDRLFKHYDKIRLLDGLYFHNKLYQMLLSDTLILVCKIEDNLTEEQAFLWEVALIKHYGRRDIGTGILYNLDDGGSGSSGYSHTEKTRKKMSISQSTKECTIDFRLKISNIFRGKKKSKEHVEKLTKIIIEQRSNPIESFNLITKITIKTYQSFNEAFRDGYHSSNVHQCLYGLSKSHKGVGWRYTEKTTEIKPIDPNSFAYQPFD